MPSYKQVLILGAVTLFSLSAKGQDIKAECKFDFGSGKVKKGYIPVTDNTVYSKERGYGFLPGSTVRSVNRGGDALKGDYISSDKPFYFSVKLPEGNYDVKVILGDKEGTSSQTVRAECRRLMIPPFKTEKGEIVERKFSVHIRTSKIAGTTESVRLKPRELNYFHWDDQLTLEFNGKEPKVCAIEIKPAKKPVTVFLAGNSTVVDQSEEPWAAWGQMIPSFFKPGKVAVANYAESGEALYSFRSAKRLEKILSLMKPGDYLFIEFGHNDQKRKGEGIGPFTSYKSDLKYYIAEARKRGGIPVLVTSMHRRNFDASGKIVNTLGDYPEAVRQAGKEENVPVIDLNNMSKELYEAWGVEPSLKAFVHYPANSFPNQTQAIADNTHFSTYGAYEIARCIAKGIKDNNLGLAKHLKGDLPDFDPGQPDPIESFVWPLSPPSASIVKPDGN